MMWSRLFTAAFAAICSLAEAQPAMAQVADEPASTAPALSAPLQVFVDASDASLDSAALRASLSRELRREVALTRDAAAASVRIRMPSPARVHVEYDTPRGETLAREVELPADEQRSLEVLSWLTVNLVRDEASEVLAELRARRKEEAEARAAEQQATVAAAGVAESTAAAASAKAAADKVAADKAAEAKRKSELRVEPSSNAGLLREPSRSFDLALVTPIAVVGDSPKREMRLQLALVYGDSGGISGVGVSPFGLRVRQDLLGHAVGAGFVIVGGDVRGTVVSAGYSHVEGNLQGVQVGAGLAWQRGKLARGVLASAGAAIAGDLTGVVVGAGLASARSLHGVAVAAGATVVRGPASGIMVGAGANWAQDVRGLQVSGGVNFARDLSGIAIAPLNMQRKVRGFQIGIVNIAEEVDGAALGIISLSKNGRLQPVLWGGSNGSAHLALKSIAGFVFTQIGGGIDLSNNALGYEGGVGLHWRLNGQLFFEPGVHYSGTQGASDDPNSGPLDHHDAHYLFGAGVRIGNKLDLLGAAGVRHRFSGGDVGTVAPEARAGIAFF